MSTRPTGRARRAPAATRNHIALSPILDVADEGFGDDQPPEWAAPHWSSDGETPGLHVAEWDALED